MDEPIESPQVLKIKHILRERERAGVRLHMIGRSKLNESLIKVP
jgi:hypothetical protein